MGRLVRIAGAGLALLVAYALAYLAGSALGHLEPGPVGGFLAANWWWFAAGLAVLLVVRGARRIWIRRPASAMMPLVPHVILIVVLGLAVFGATAAGLWLAIGRPRLPHESILDTRGGQDLVKLGLTVVGGLGGVVALVVAYRRQLVAEEENTRAEEESRRIEARDRREERKLLTERYATSCALLGHDAAAVRMSGILAVGALADDWTDSRQACIEVLCAYLRLPYAPDPDSPRWREGEREVRLAVIKVIRDHLRKGDAPWRGHHFDLSGAVLDGGDFSGIELHDGTTLDFRRARLVGGVLSFRDASFLSGSADFREATFEGALVDFSRAGFRDFELRRGIRLNLARSVLRAGRLTFAGARLQGGLVDLRGTVFAGGTVDLRGVGRYEVPPRFDPFPDGVPPPGLLTPIDRPVGQ